MIICPRCTVQAATEGALEAHLLYEHAMSNTRAHQEAREAATGERLDAAGKCDACHRPEGAVHAPSCSIAKRAGLPTGPLVAPVPPAPAMTAPVTPPPAAAPPAPKEEPMPQAQTCKKCGAPGHNARSCGRSTDSRCTRCRRLAGSHAPKCPNGNSAVPAAAKRKAERKAAARPAKRAATATAATRNDRAPLADNVAKASAEQLLGHLRALRSRLDEKITHVAELCSIL